MRAACAIVLLRVEEAQFHLGLRRSDEPHEPVLHLAWHRHLKNDALSKLMTRQDGSVLPAAVVTLALDPLIDETLQVLASRVAIRYANQPAPLFYGFGEASPGFDTETGLLSDPNAAFTCATFVLALLRSVGVLLVDVTRWRAPTEQDLQWQQEIGNRLLAWIERHVHGDLAYAKERVGRDLGSRRYLPTDVAGAALTSPDMWPVGAKEVNPRAQELESLLPWPSTPL